MEVKEIEKKPNEKEKGFTLKICPRCGQPYSYITKQTVKGHTYWYAVHYIEVDGKKMQKKCYLGADKYIYVNKLIGNMIEVRNIISSNPLSYLRDVLENIIESEDEELIKQSLEVLDEYGKALKEKLGSIRQVESE